MSVIQSNCGEFATFKSLEFDGFGTVCNTNPVEFHGVKATQRCTIQKSATLSHLLGGAQKSEAFSHIAWREGNSLEFEGMKGGTGRYGGTSRHILSHGNSLRSQKNRGNAAVLPVSQGFPSVTPTFGRGLGR